MTDQEKFKKLFDELGIKYEENGNVLYIDTFNCDGAREFGISFWDGEYYPEGSYHEFWVVPDEYRREVHLKDLDEEDKKALIKLLTDNPIIGKVVYPDVLQGWRYEE